MTRQETNPVKYSHIDAS